MKDKILKQSIDGPDIDSYFSKKTRPYDYRENLIREESRIRKNRKQLIFSNENLSLIKQRVKEYNCADFSNYIRFCIYNKEISKADIENCSSIPNERQNRKQVCFSDEEIEDIKNKMEQLECNNFNLYIRTIAVK